MAIDRATEAETLVGSPLPRIAPPQPVRHGEKHLTEFAKGLGISFYPWQRTLARYLTAVGPDGGWLYGEVAGIVGRQNGKTEMLVPLIVSRMVDPEQPARIMHTAQNAKIPREVHERVADLLLAKYPRLLPSKRAISYAYGDERIKLTNGGKYRIVPPTKSGARGPSVDLLIVDELREMEDFEFMAASEPTTSASANPQIVYLSNAGSDASVVLNALRKRRDLDPRLAYLEWSADPETPAEDRNGWLQANPSIGHNAGKLRYLEEKLLKHQTDETMHIFETEYLCRWVVADEDLLVPEMVWQRQDFSALGPSQRKAVMAVKVAMGGARASAVVAWLEADGRVAVDVVADVSPFDARKWGPAFAKKALEYRANVIGFDPYTDGDLLRYLKTPTRGVIAKDWGLATDKFAVLADLGQLHVMDDTGALGEDLKRTTKRKSPTHGTYVAVRAGTEPNTAAEAAIRAVWLASDPNALGRAEIH